MRFDRAVGNRANDRMEQPSSIPKTTTDMRSAFAIATIGLLAVGARLPGLFTDLWVDEIWSLHDVLALQSWTDIFVTLRIDNNHHLNGLWLYLLDRANIRPSTAFSRSCRVSGP